MNNKNSNNHTIKEHNMSSDIESITESTLYYDKDDIYSNDDNSLYDIDFENDSESNNSQERKNSTADAKKISSSSKQPRRYSGCCICQRIITPIIVLFIVIIFFIYYFGDSSTLQGIIPGTDFLFAQEDLGEQYAWERSTAQIASGGLSLTIINALQTDWYTYFDAAIQDWDNGTPDALTLTSEVASAPDPDCSMVEGYLKMCNKDYGATDWMGINEVLKYDNNEIVASIGMMNDHYFSSSTLNDAKRQYTMCHEMGHGFGLPHTDTSLWNRNTGNCLDYTNRPKQNMRPGLVNYERLVNVYGVVSNPTNVNNTGTTSSTGNNQSLRNTTTTTPTTNDTNNDDNNNNNTNSPNDTTMNEGDKNNKDDKNKDDRILVLKQNVHRVPQHIMDKLRDVQSEIVVPHNNNQNQRSLRSEMNYIDDHQQHQVIHLGDGYSVHIQYLKSFPMAKL